MIEYKTGNMFAIKTDVIVNTVNCVGVMGKGVALECKRRWPEMYEVYRRACYAKEIKPGYIMQWYGEDMTIINFATKNHWKNKSKYEWIEEGLKALRIFIQGIPSDFIVSIPPLGCGNGGLDWLVVKPMIIKYLGDLKQTIYLFEPKE